MNNMGNCSLKSDTGQAMLELSIFGSLMLLVLGLIVSYGLNADYNQAAQMSAFRKALHLAGEPDASGEPIGSASYSSIQERYFANPSHPLGLGSPTTVSSSASVVRDVRLDTSPVVETELPRLRIDAQGSPLDCAHDQSVFGPGCLTSGFRIERNIPRDDDPNKSVLEKYRLIYGSSNVLNCSELTPPCGGDEDVMIIDSCDGEIIDYTTCVLQARQIVNPGVCQVFCERSQQPGSTLQCNQVCALEMNPPNQSDRFVGPNNGAWYAEDYSIVSGSGFTTVYKFPRLLGGPGVFDGVRALGIQRGTTFATQQHVKLTNTEDNTKMHNRLRVNTWNDVVTRKLIQKEYGQTTTRKTNKFNRWTRCPDGQPCTGEHSTIEWDTSWR